MQDLAKVLLEDTSNTLVAGILLNDKVAMHKKQDKSRDRTRGLFELIENRLMRQILKLGYS